MEIQINEIRTKDKVIETMNLVETTFMEFVGNEYTQEGIDEFLSYTNVDNILSLMDEDKIIIFGAFVHDKIVGMITMRQPCAITLMFVDKEYHHKGIAKQLFNYVLEHWYDGKQPIAVHSSPYAIPAYEKLGFVIDGEEQVSSGIRFQPMVYHKQENDF